MKLLALLLFTAPAIAQNLTVAVPAGCTATPATVAITCSVTPPPTCPPGQTGTPPNCVTPPPSGSACPGFPSTVHGTLPWTPPSSTWYSAPNGGFAVKGALVASFTTPATKPTGKAKGSIVLVEFSGPPADRSGSLSMTACDFVGGIQGKGVFVNAQGPNIAFWFSSMAQPPGQNLIELQASTTYYLNVHNPLGCSPGPDCDVKIELNVPQ
jgi:hypothetical protein